MSDVYKVHTVVNPTFIWAHFCSVWCDTTLVLSKTGTCFSQSGTFSSRRHPINLGINSHACATMAMLTEWQLPCHFRFVPLRESSACCMPPGRPPRTGTLAFAKIYTDQSICMSGTDNTTQPADIRHSIDSTERGHNSCRTWSSGERDRSLCVCRRIP